MICQLVVRYKIPATLFWGLLFSFCSYADSIPGVPKLYEKENNWCWAAATECVVKYYDPSCTKSQKQIASVITTQNEAPPPKDIIKCLEENGKSVNLQAEMVERPLTWTEIKTEADENRPFIMLIRWNSGGYHCNVNAGYIRDSTKIKWMEPIQPPGRFVYRSYKKSLEVNDRGKWESSFLTRIGTPITKEFVPQAHTSSPFRIITGTSQQSDNSITFIFTEHIRGPGTLNIFNALGTCVYSSIINKNSTTVPWAHAHTAPSGMYYVLLRLPHTQSVKNIHKQSFYYTK